MEEEGPCELVFYNPETGNYAIFDRKRLRFEKSWHATLYLSMQPNPPPGLKWLKVFGTEEDVEKGSIDFDALLKESIKGSGSPLFEIVIKLISTGKIYVCYTEERDTYASREKAENMLKYLIEICPTKEGYEYLIIDYEEDKKLPLAPFMKAEVKEEHKKKKRKVKK